MYYLKSKKSNKFSRRIVILTREFYYIKNLSMLNLTFKCIKVETNCMNNKAYYFTYTYLCVCILHPFGKFLVLS